MRDSLSDITKRDGTKLTRRRVMKLATGAGLSAPVAANMTASDVKAADSDQVTIAIDIGGNTKERVDSDWLEWHQMARKANRSIKSRHFGKDGIKWIGRTGVRKNLNPHIRVAIDEDHPQAGERRGEIPEEKKKTVLRWLCKNTMTTGETKPVRLIVGLNQKGSSLGARIAML